MDAELSSARILIVDDEPVNVLLLGRILHAAGYTPVTSSTDPLEAIALYRDAVGGPDAFDLVCTDLHMPGASGLEVVEQVMAATPHDEFVPIVMLTADVTSEAEQEALARGAQDFITKPFRPPQIRLRVANLLRTRALQRQLRMHADGLEILVQARTAELEAARGDILHRLAAAAEYRDYTTGQHTQRVGALSSLLAAQLGCDDETVELVRRAAQLHDVGKIGVPDSILLKPGRLTAAEFRVMQEHVDVGARLLANGESQLIVMAETIARTHHERWDGSGYPAGSSGDDIPLVGQIVAVADVFDTLMNDRPYKVAWDLESALAEIVGQRGRWFSPRLVDAFLEVLDAHPHLIDELRDVNRDGGRAAVLDAAISRG